MVQFLPALPEIVLAICAMVLLVAGAFTGERATRTISYLALFALVVIAVLVIRQPEATTVVAFNGLFKSDGFARIFKLLVLIGSGLSILLSMDWLEREKIARPEYPVLILLATLGMLAMTSANDLLSLYVGLELQSLSLYVLAAFQRDTVRSSEAGLKYFVLGALSSGLLLWGTSLVYGFAGTTQFDRLAALFNAGAPGVGVIIGLVFVAAGLAFKVSAVPFHMWTPDVYEGAPTPVTALFAMAPKVAAMALFVRVLVGPFGHLLPDWRQIILFASVASMLLGSFAAIAQKNVKRLMAYSSIANVGYALLGLAAGGQAGVQGVIIYMAIYVFMTAGSFGVILAMRRNGTAAENLDDLAGLGRTRPGLAIAMLIFMFALAGIPPLAGFWGKYYVFIAAIHAGDLALAGAQPADANLLYVAAVIGVLTSAVAAFYYLRIVKIMYFDEPAPALDASPGRAVEAVVLVSVLVMLVVGALPTTLIDASIRAAKTLLSA
jgi:NADH-quinone oxidoreductase subunit N